MSWNEAVLLGRLRVGNRAAASGRQFSVRREVRDASRRAPGEAHFPPERVAHGQVEVVEFGLPAEGAADEVRGRDDLGRGAQAAVGEANVEVAARLEHGKSA